MIWITVSDLKGSANNSKATMLYKVTEIPKNYPDRQEWKNHRRRFKR